MPQFVASLLAILPRRLPPLAALFVATMASAEAPRPPVDLRPVAPAAPMTPPGSLFPQNGAAGKSAASTAKPTPLDSGAAIQKANAYFNGAATMVGDFVQVGADGRRSEGKLYVQRPGRLRFEYARPASLEVIADGTSVAIRDRKLATQDLYFIGQTPLKFLLKDQIDLSRDAKILDVSSDPTTTTIYIEDKATLGGTSKIKLMFDPVSFQLKQWQVTDPQGFDTVVSLFNVDFKQKPDPSLFKINTERMIDVPN
ncbi:MAG: outer membrane lipoprotein carrier protein LolA [Beijerinckiaceae bacterium]